MASSSAAWIGALFLSNGAVTDAFTATPSLCPITACASSTSSSLSPLRASKSAETLVPDLASSTQPVDEADVFSDVGRRNGDEEEDASWQANLDVLLAPDTSVAERQIVLSGLLSSGEEIQESVRTALRERNVSWFAPSRSLAGALFRISSGGRRGCVVRSFPPPQLCDLFSLRHRPPVSRDQIDGLLTPTQKRLQDGTRAVARQLTTDILPGIAAVAAGEKTSPGGSKELKSPVDVLVADLPTVVPKIGSRVLNAISNQARNNLKELQEDIRSGDPLRGISRIQERTEGIAAEAKNVFLETPEGLVGPPYAVLSRGEGYEIRQYESCSVASTSMSQVDQPYTMDDLASGGEAFNALAAYIFGANEEKEVMEMTTPVTTTSSGEMRFYLREREGGGGFPLPVAENDEVFNEKGAVSVKEIPAATLAVAKFTGFVTEGEVARQKDALMTCLALDGIEIDVPHAAVVPYVLFQYNPPYTIPILRRNEIGIPVRLAAGGEEEEAEARNLSRKWDVEDANGSADAEE